MTIPMTALVCDAPFEERALGITRTLMNVFSAFPVDRVIVCSPGEGTVGGFRHESWRSPVRFRLRNRLSTVVNPLLEAFDLAGIAGAADGLARRIAAAGVKVLVVSANLLSTFVMARELRNRLKIPVVLYLMDDWRDLEGRRVPGGTSRALLDDLLEHAGALLTISAELREALVARHRSVPARWMALHNPVVLDEARLDPLTADDEFTLAYAGSVWGMHRDALEVLCAAVRSLAEAGERVTLELFGPQDSLSPFVGGAVGYGGFLPYADLRTRLRRSHLLAVVSAFDASQRFLVEASLQTKVSDYLACGRPVLAVGPEYAASNRFLERGKCGVTIASRDTGEVARRILELRDGYSALAPLTERGIEVLRDGHTIESMLPKLESLMREVAA